LVIVNIGKHILLCLISDANVVDRYREAHQSSFLDRF